jgi:Na+/H+ antiporter NhaD/arsenite permease-like protein
MDFPQLITLAIFIFSYVLIFSGKFDRTIAALFGLFLMVSSGYLLGFTTFEKILTNVNWEVIILLFGMMTYVGLLAQTGFFKYLGVKTVIISKGQTWRIFLYLSLLTAFISMVVDNVTTILLIIPMTIEIAKLQKINPIPFMLSEAILSNIGGVGTFIGDPPNVIIGFAAGYSFNDFIVHLFPPVIVIIGLSLLLGRFIYKNRMKQDEKEQMLIMEKKPSDYITDKKKMRYLLIILGGMILFFILEQYTGISAAFVALAGCSIALLISFKDPREIFTSVEWSTLIFFIALFSLVGGLYETGLLTDFAKWLISSSSNNVLLMAIIILWMTGLLSAVVDNIPITTALVPVVAIISSTYHSNILWWALAMGVGLGGNITYIGSSAGVMTISLSKKYDYEITNKEWLKFGLPVGIVSLIVCSLFLVIM